ncbi:MAG: NAD-dependent epimerase/dehydratase family protein [Flavobacteriales bacterium]|nr:NAD-dependent epimerase/dehydratase family protein [Flavobacteriales bacterium]
MDLVTGGTGIVGSHLLLHLLEQGRAVRATRRAGSDVEVVRRVFRHYRPDGDALFDRIHWVEADLLDPTAVREAMEGVQRVYHAAALVSFDPRDERALFKQNTEATARVVNAALEAGVQRLLHVSSTATIGKAAQGLAADEQSPWTRDKRTSPYAVSKHEAELEVQRGIAEGLDAVIVNPCVIIGPGKPGRSSMTMVERVRRGTAWFPPGSNAVVDARDVAAFSVALMDKGATGERHLLVGENLTYEQLFGLITAAAGKPAPTRRIPGWMLQLAWRMERLRTLFGGRPFITRHTAHSALSQRRYDGTKAATVTGLACRSAEEAVRNAVRYLG